MSEPELRAELAKAQNEAATLQNILDALRQEISGWSPARLISERDELRTELDALKAKENAMIDARIPRAEAATEAVERFTSAFDATLSAIPDMDRNELIYLREAIADLDGAIEKEQGERD